MMRIGLESDESHLVQVVDDSLDVLPICPHIPSQPRNRLRALGVGDGAEYFPTGARQSELRHQAVACGSEQVGESEQIKDKVGHRISGRGSFCAAQHLSPSNTIDIMMSLRYQRIYGNRLTP